MSFISQRSKQCLETAQSLLRITQTMTDRAIAGQLADSDEVARVKRDEAARDSWMMSPAVTE